MFILSLGLQSPFRREKIACSRVYLAEESIYMVAYVNAPSKTVIKSFQWGEHCFGLTTNNGNAMIYERFGNRISEFSINLLLEQSHEVKRSFLKYLNDGESFFFTSLLVDLKTNEIVALRVFGLSQQFNYLLCQIFQDQFRNGHIAKPIFNQSIEKIWSTLPHKEKGGTR